MKKSLVVFAPHPDDETLGCGGTIAKKLEEGYEVRVVILTDGRNAFSVVLGIGSEPNPQELKQIRRIEAEKALGELGVAKEKIIFLDFEDDTLEGNAIALEKAIAREFVEFSPNEIYVTSEKDVHSDHKVACRAVHTVVNRLGLNSVIYQYSIAQKYSRIGPLRDRVINVVTRTLANINVSEYLSAKRRAIEEYKSQVSIISAKQNRPIIENIARFLRKKEVFTKV